MRLKPDWRETLRRELDRPPRKTMRGVSLAAGLGVTAIFDWLQKGKTPEPDKVLRVANVLGLPPEAFIVPEDKNAVPFTLGAPSPVKHARLIGEVEAGAWRVPGMLDIQEDIEIPYVSDREYGGLEQYAFKVRGSSMDLRAPPGSFAIGVRFIDLHRDPKDGEMVVCERRMAGTVEYTLKRVRYRKGGVALVPESTDPRFQQPVWLSSEGVEDLEEVEATFLIIGIYMPRP